MQKSEQELMEEANRLFGSGDHVRAEKIFRKALREEPDNAQLLFMIGQCRSRQGDRDGAIENLRRAVKLDDNQYFFHFHLGRICLEANRIDEGHEALGQAIGLNPNYAEARTLLGYSWLRHGKLDRAETELRTARRANPNYTPALNALALLLLEKGELEEAAGIAGQAASQNPADPATQLVFGKVLLAQGHYDFAEQCWRRALEHHPGHPDLKSGLARTLWKTGRLEEAVQEFEALIRGGHRPVALMLDYARCQADRGRKAEARQVLEQIVRQAPQAAEAPRIRQDLARLRHEDGDHDGALELLQELPEDDFPGRLIKARILARAGQADEALMLYAALVEAPDKEIAHRARLAAAGLHLEQGNARKAREELEPLLAATPPDIDGVLFWAAHLEKDQAFAEAEQLVRGVLEGESLDEGLQARLRNWLGRLLDQQEKYEEAAGYLEDAAWITPGLIDILRSPEIRKASETWAGTDASAFEGLPASSPDKRPAMVWILGWPGSGRDLMISALSRHSRIKVLDPRRWNEREGNLMLASGPDDLSDRHDGQWQVRRRKYFRSVGAYDPEAILLEPAWRSVASLPAIARQFPDSRVIAMAADEADLHLHWLFHGYRGAMDMLQEYRREQQLFRHMSTHLPLNFRIVPRGRLLGSDAETTLADVCSWLGLTPEAGMSGHLTEAGKGQSHWPDGHWRKYAGLLGRD